MTGHLKYKYTVIIVILLATGALLAAQNALGQDSYQITKTSSPAYDNNSQTSSYAQSVENYKNTNSAYRSPGLSANTSNHPALAQAITTAESGGYTLTGVVSKGVDLRYENGRFVAQRGQLEAGPERPGNKSANPPTLTIDPNQPIQLIYSHPEKGELVTPAYKADSESLKEFVGLLGEYPGDGNRSFSVEVKSSDPVRSNDSKIYLTAERVKSPPNSPPQNENPNQSPPSGNGQTTNPAPSTVKPPIEELKTKSVRILSYSEGYNPDIKFRGSGAVLGTDKNGYPVIATAGHLDGATESGRLFIVEFADKSRSLYRVAGGFLNEEEADLSILTFSSSPDEKIKKFTGALLGSSAEDIKTGSLATRIGYPADREFEGRVRISSLRIKEGGNSYVFDGQVKDDKSPSFGTYRGESGSPLFNEEGKLIGITIATGSGAGGRYIGTYQINYLVNYLRQHGYIINME